MIDLRDCFWDEIERRMEYDHRIIILLGDQGFFKYPRFQEKFPGRILNMGPQEQNIMSVAAGLAREGYFPIVHAILPFATFRCFEQIKLDIALHKLPVLITGMGAGLCYSFEGPTHHGIHDVGVMRMIPELAIYNPSNKVGMRDCLSYIFERQEPAYLRMDKKMVRDDDQVLHVYHDSKTLIVSTGMAETILTIQEELEKEEIEVDALDIYQLEPFGPWERIFDMYENLIIIDEHSRRGGLETIICEELPGYHKRLNIVSIGLPHQHINEYGDREFLLKKYGLDKESIKQKIRQVVSGENRG